MRVVVDSAIPYIRGVIEPYAEVSYVAGAEIDRAILQHCDAMLIRTRTRCNEQLLKGSNIRFIATATIGTDHIDLDWCSKHNITVASAPGCNARGVLQWVTAVLKHICTSRGLHPADLTLGVVGVGSVGSLVVEYARSWGFRVLRCDPPRKAVEGGDFLTIEELAPQCDIITLHTPLDNSTYHLINSELISTLKSNAIILNASRGGVVDNAAMRQSEHPYYFDVWEGEPEIASDILQCASLATPHVAGYSEQGKANASAMVIRALAREFDLPLKEWYPSEVTPTTPRSISWQEVLASIDNYYPITEESIKLKRTPEDFERMRNSYIYRKEYF